MRVRFLGLILPALFTIVANAQDPRPALSKEVRKDLAALQGTWQLESYESGKKGKVDLKKRTLFIGADLYIVREENTIIQIGNVRLNPTKKPNRMDVVVRKGLHADNTMLGIYEIKDDSLTVCFDPEGENRPMKFGIKPDTEMFVAKYKRIRRPDERVDIVGRYISTSYDLEGKKKSLAVDIEKRGDAYLLKWNVGGKIAFVGAGIRKGNTLSVAYFNPASAGLSIYTIEKGPKLTGVFTDVGGPGIIAREELRFAPEDKVEVRR